MFSGYKNAKYILRVSLYQRYPEAILYMRKSVQTSADLVA